MKRVFPVGLLLAAGLLLAGGAVLTRPPERPFRYAVHTVRAADQPLRLIAEAGFDTVIQLLSWREVEPAPGEWYWEYPDQVVRAAAYYGLDVVFRLDQQPAWARPGRLNAPPRDETLYPAFVRRVAERYRGRVVGYIIWNEPNLAHEWGGDPPDPEGYARLLGAAARAVREADPRALVIAAGLAPTNEVSPRALDDRIFLRRQLAAPGGREFDVLAVHAYGFGLPPQVPAETNQGLNVRRIEQQRRILLEAGLGDRPVWITELGWTVDPTSPVGAPAVSEEQRGAYLVETFQQAAREWPWLGMVAVWVLGADEPDDDNQAGFRLAEAGYQPKPSWRMLHAMAKPPPSRPLVPWPLSWPGASRQPVEVLADDVPIHLGDQPDLAAPWRPIWGFGPFALSWQGEFYLRDPSGDWELEAVVLQANDRGNHFRLNGELLVPPYWPGRDWDYASYWSRLRFRVPPGVLRAGRNVLELRVGQWLPAFQVANNRWEDLQVRGIRLLPAGWQDGGS